MSYRFGITTLILLGSTIHSYADLPTTSKDHNTTKVEEEKEKNRKIDPITEALENEQKKLSLENALKEETLRSQHGELLKQLQMMKWKNEVLSEQFALKKIEHESQSYDETQAQEKKLTELEYNAKLADMNNSKISREREMKKAVWEMKISKLESEISTLKIEKERDTYIDTKLTYLDVPLKDDNKTLIISDRRIALNGVIRGDSAEYVTSRINYYNNKDKSKPIFIVIDSSPGGSVLAGYLILKAMESSEAPIYVVLKSDAASMAALIVTLADRSYAYENATILHHQPMSLDFGYSNLTEQKEKYERLKKWWDVLGASVAKKMGITTEELRLKMYENSSSGDWSEFAVDAQKLKWVDHIVSRIEEKSLLKDPDSEEKKKDSKKILRLEESFNKTGKPVVYLPHLSPLDAYFMYNPDAYYQVR